MFNPYIQYYLELQEGCGIPVFRGSSWQREYGQTGYGLGGLFRSFGKIAKPMIKSGTKALGKIVLTSGVNLLGDVLSGKNPSKQQKPVLWKVRTLQRCKPYNEHKDMLKPVEVDLNPPSVRPNAELKRERHLHL